MKPQILSLLFLLGANVFFGQNLDLAVPNGRNGWITSVDFSPDGNYIISGNLDMTLKLWDIKTGEELKTFGKTLPRSLKSSVANDKRDTERKIVYANFTYSENKPFWQYGAPSIQDLIFQAAERGEIELLYFKKFNKKPEVVSFSSFKESLIRPIEFYDKWDSNKTDFYTYGVTVSHNGRVYRYIGRDYKSEPSKSTSWEIIKGYIKYYELFEIGLDLVTVNNKTQLNFLHFFEENTGYKVSVGAKDAAHILNNSKLVWHNTSANFMSQIIDGVPIYSYSQNKDIILRDLISNNETLNLDLSQKILDIDLESPEFWEYSPPFFFSYKSGKVADIYFPDFMGNEMYYQFIDKISLEALKKKSYENFYQFYGLGDALLQTELIEFSSKDPVILKPFVNLDYNWESIHLKEMTLITEESFPKEVLSTEDINLISLMMDDIYKGIETEQLSIYHSDSLSHPRTSHEIAEILRIPNSDGAANDGWGNDADDSWGSDLEKNEIETFQIFDPSQIWIRGIQYKIVFTINGNLISKDPISIILEIPASNFVTGIPKTLGFVKFSELEKSNKLSFRNNWLSILDKIKKQQFIYQMNEFKPLISNE